MIIASIPKTTTNFILLLMPISHLKSIIKWPQKSSLPTSLPYYIGDPIFFEDSFIPYAFVDFVDSDDYNSAWRKERVVEFQATTQPKLLFLQFNVHRSRRHDMIMPNHDTYPDGLGSKPSYAAILAVDPHQVTHSTDSPRSRRGNCRSIIGGCSYCSFI